MKQNKEKRSKLDKLDDQLKEMHAVSSPSFSFFLSFYSCFFLECNCFTDLEILKLLLLYLSFFKRIRRQRRLKPVWRTSEGQERHLMFAFQSPKALYSFCVNFPVLSFGFSGLFSLSSLTAQLYQYSSHLSKSKNLFKSQSQHALSISKEL